MSKVSGSSLGIVVVVQEHVRAGNCSVQRRGSQSRLLLQRAELIYYVTQSPWGS